MKKVILFILLLIAFLNLLNLNKDLLIDYYMFGDKLDGEDFITTSNKTNAKLTYYYFVPPNVKRDLSKSYPLLAIIPGLSCYGRAMITAEIKRFANDNKFVILAPTFIMDEENYLNQTSYQHPRYWSGKAFINIIKKLNTQGIKTNKLYFLGISAGAQFSLRFSIWQPKLVEKCAAHASGQTIVPDKYIPVKFFVSVGTNDEKYRIDNVNIFYDKARQYNISVEKKFYNGQGHMLSEDQIKDSLNFFKKKE